MEIPGRNAGLTYRIRTGAAALTTRDASATPRPTFRYILPLGHNSTAPPDIRFPDHLRSRRHHDGGVKAVSDGKRCVLSRVESCGSTARGPEESARFGWMCQGRREGFGQQKTLLPVGKAGCGDPENEALACAQVDLSLLGGESGFMVPSCEDFTKNGHSVAASQATANPPRMMLRSWMRWLVECGNMTVTGCGRQLWEFMASSQIHTSIFFHAEIDR